MVRSSKKIIGKLAQEKKEKNVFITLEGLWNVESYGDETSKELIRIFLKDTCSTAVGASPARRYPWNTLIVMTNKMRFSPGQKKLRECEISLLF